MQYQERPARFEYRLTAKGRELFPVLLTMLRWSNRWLVEDDMDRVAMKHLGCDSQAEAKLICSHCQQALTPAAVRIEQATEREENHNI